MGCLWQLVGVTIAACSRHTAFPCRFRLHATPLTLPFLRQGGVVHSVWIRVGSATVNGSADRRPILRCGGGTGRPADDAGAGAGCRHPERRRRRGPARCHRHSGTGQARRPRGPRRRPAGGHPEPAPRVAGHSWGTRPAVTTLVVSGTARSSLGSRRLCRAFLGYGITNSK